jgi:capsular polysaccharide transport system ATP-binding protein
MIKLNNVTKFFKTNNSRKYILKDVSLTIPSGISVGILGRNGVGKSTLLKMLGQIEFPNYGSISSKNTFSWPMGLGGGFQGSMTGKQNIKFVARIYQKDESEIKSIISFVKDFAQIGEYYNMPIKNYSSGMKSRLSFGLSLAFDFDYLIIDETLSVGDENFKKKAKQALIDKINKCNILLVSHSMGDLRQLCDAGIVLDDGKIYYFDDIKDAIEKYHQLNSVETQNTPSIQSSAIYCSDGKVFDNITQAAIYYKVRPYGIIQAIEQNNGSHTYLKKVFYRDGTIVKPYQNWDNYVENETIISSDGIIFDNANEATSFYRDRISHITIEDQHIENIVKQNKILSKKLNIKFYYLSEYLDG